MKKIADRKWTQKVHSLRQRMRLILIFGIMVWCLVVIAVFQFTFRVSEKNRTENGMRADIRQLTKLLDEEYYSLVKMSQQMTAEGSIGSSFSAYLQAEEPYDKIEESTNVTTDINTMIFNYDTGTLASYFYTEGGNMQPMFSSMPVQNDAFAEELPMLVKSSEIEFHTFHDCLNTFFGKQVISLTRRENFENEDYLIYTEKHVGIEDVLELLSMSRNVSYTMLQLDQENRVCCSTNPEYEAGGFFKRDEDEKAGFGGAGRYRYVIGKSDFGFYNVLLVRHASYLRQEYLWQMNIALIFVIGIISIAAMVILIFNYIYKPIRQLGQDMEDAGKGNLQPVEHAFGMDEFDGLFSKFNDMKDKVAGLMEEVRRSEYEKQQLEIEKLYYQINPHFLMNALNSLHWMAVANHQKEIEEYIYQLNFILGYSLGKIYKKSTFGTELKSLEMYLDLQKKRYDFNVWLDIRMNGWLEYPCARLILQPLAENAICHNMDAFGNLWITMTCDGNKARIEIRDDGQGIRFLNGEAVSAKRQNKGIGLRYVQMSLRSFYGDQAKLQIESEVNRGTSVIVDIPLRVHKEEEDNV